MLISELNIDLDAQLAAAHTTMPFGAHDLDVRKYLPVAEKSDLITYVIKSALDERTGTCAPIRLEIYFALPIAHWYAGIDLPPENDPSSATTLYDTLEISGFYSQLVTELGTEYANLLTLVEDTVEDMTRYNNSVAGTLELISKDSTEIDSQLSSTLEKIRNKEGLELLEEIKNVGGTD